MPACFSLAAYCRNLLFVLLLLSIRAVRGAYFYILLKIAVFQNNKLKIKRLKLEKGQKGELLFSFSSQEKKREAEKKTCFALSSWPLMIFCHKGKLIIDNGDETYNLKVMHCLKNHIVSSFYLFTRTYSLTTCHT